MKSCLIVEDLADARHWLSQAARTAFDGVAVETAGSLSEARAHLASFEPFDLAIVDLGLPDGNGVDFIVELSFRSPQTLVIVASIFDDDSHIFPALRAGAQGYLLKDQGQSTIVELLRGISDGQPPLSPSVARRMLSHFRAPQELANPNLTERETEVLRLIARGLTAVEAARLLGISPNTASSYVKEIYRKLNVSSRAEAAITARNLGLV